MKAHHAIAAWDIGENEGSAGGEEARTIRETNSSQLELEIIEMIVRRRFPGDGYTILWRTWPTIERFVRYSPKVSISGERFGPRPAEGDREEIRLHLYQR